MLFLPTYIALGSNLGDRKSNIVQAIDHIIRTPGVRMVGLSSLYETAPVDMPPDTAHFLNAVLALQVTLDPETLHHRLREIETRLGRDPHHPKYTDRTIDLDLLLYADQVITARALTIPHPKLHERRFVLEPLAELDPTLNHPTLNQTVTALLEHLPPSDCHRVD
jgi:2-amino-4-hydroxy-6-hydroxymethyldihydropteridine diphosphokinase